MPTKTKTISQIPLHQAFRDAVLECEDNRQYSPAELSVIREALIPEYVPVFDTLIESGLDFPVQVSLEGDTGRAFIRTFLQANGKNRTRKPGHFLELAKKFRDDYDSSCTHYVLMEDNMVGNAGHSSMAAALAFYPEDIFYGLAGSPVMLGKGEDAEYVSPESEEGQELLEHPKYYVGDVNGKSVVLESYVPTMPSDWEWIGEYDENGLFVVGSDNPDFRDEAKPKCTLVLQAPVTACLKMDDLRLEADYADFLEMVPEIRSHLTTLPSPVDTKLVGEVLRNWYLRTSHKPAKTTDDTDKFGTLSKGGRTTKSDVQQWYLTAIPMLLESLELLKNEAGVIRNFPFWTSSKESGTKGKVSLAHALVALMVSDQAGREAIAKILVDPAPKAKGVLTMRDHIVVPNRSDCHTANGDSIVSMLVLFGTGKKDPASIVFDESLDTPAWHIEENRAPTWDRCDTWIDDDSEESRAELLVYFAEQVAKSIGSEAGITSAKRKAPKGKRSRKAKA